jgi:hypothetical protein
MVLGSARKTTHIRRSEASKRNRVCIHKKLRQEVSFLRHRVRELEHSEPEPKQAELFRGLATKILCILNNPSPLADAIGPILAAIKQETGFDAVGIRLRNGDDFPYFVQNGFSHDFLIAENSLIARNSSGGPCRDASGNISLECTCGLVLSGKADPSHPLFTEAGSAWTNNSLPLLELSPDQDPRLHPRNNCIHQGYLSVALIPIRARGEIVGLLQLNNRRKDCFTIDIIRFFEGIGSSIGVALIRKHEEEERDRLVAELTKALSEIKVLNGLLPICSLCKRIRDDKGCWNQIEIYIKERSNADFTHSICPDCARNYYSEVLEKNKQIKLD